MADGLDRVDTTPEDFQQLLRMKPIDPDIPGVYALRFVFVFHELIESQRVEWYRAEAFLQSNLVWKASSAGEQRRRTLCNAIREYRALFAPLPVLDCTAPNREAPYPTRLMQPGGVAALYQNPYHSNHATHTPQFKAHTYNAKRDYKMEKQTIERAYYYFALLELLVTVLPSNINYHIKKESASSFSQREGEGPNAPSKSESLDDIFGDATCSSAGSNVNDSIVT